MSTVTDTMMSATISRSRIKPGRGVIRAITMPRTATGTAISRSMFKGRALSHGAETAFWPGRPGAATGFAGDIGLPGEPSVHEFEDIRQDFGHGAIEVRGNLLAHVDHFVERLRERGVLDDGDLVVDGDLADAPGQIVL